MPAQQVTDRRTVSSPMRDGFRACVDAVSRQPVPAWVVAGIVTAAYTVFSAAQWYRLETPSWDLGIFTQLAKAYAGFDTPIVPIKGDGFNLLGDHFHPLLVLLGPVYAWFPSAFTLLVVQNVLIGLSVLVIARLGIRRLGTTSGVCIALAYGLSWGIQSAVSSQFHEIAFAVPLIALSLEAVIESRLRSAVVWAGLLVFVKEDLGVTVLAIGLLVAFRFRSGAGLWLSAWGLGWLLLSVGVLLPLLNSGGSYDYADRIDVGSMLSNPVGTFLSMASAGEKYYTLWLLALAGGFLLLRSPLALIMVPTLLWRFVAENPSYWGPEWHYSAVLMPIVFMALIDAILASHRSRRRWLRSYSTAVVPVVTVVALMMLPSQPLGSLADPDTYRPSPRWDAAHRLMDRIPDGASVESGVVLMPYLVPQTEVFWIGNDNPAPDYLIVDGEDFSWGGTPPADAEQHAEQTYPGIDYTPVFNEAGYQLVERTGR